LGWGLRVSAHSDQFVEHTTTAALEEKAKLQKHFTRFDIYFFLICTIVGVDTLGQVASNGPEGFTWLLFLAVFFFVPYALLTAELGAAFPEEGGAYVWTRLAFGRLVAAINAIFYWFSNPVWIGATLALLAIASVQSYFWHFSDGGFWYYTVGLAYIWFSVYSAILSFGIGKWIPTIGAWCRMFVLGLFTITTIVYAAKHGLHLPSGGKFAPSYTLFIALVPILFFNYVGFELPSAAGDEMEDAQKDVPITVLRACVTAILMYGLPILAIVCVLPPDSISGVSGFMDAVAVVFTVYGGAASFMTKLAAIGFILALVSSACTWLMGSDRSQAVACYDGAGPRFLGNFSAKLGTPVNVNFLSGIFSTIVFIAASKLADGNAGATFSVMIGVVLTFTTISYIVIFPALIKLRYSHPDVHRPYRIPFGMAGVWFCGVITTFWAVFASIVAIFPGFLDGELLNNGDLPSWTDAAGLDHAVSRFKYEAISFTAIGITIAAGFVFYALGKPTRDKMVDVPLEGNEDLAAAFGD
jgi:amino acid transporter